MKKEDLYNKIINNVAKEIKNALNEKYGVMEFDNKLFTDKIQNAVLLLHEESDEKTTFGELLDNITFNKLTIDFSNILSWLDKFTIYYTFDYNMAYSVFQGIALASDQFNDCIHQTIVNNGHIEHGYMFLAIDNNIKTFDKTYTKIILHELCHLYTNKHLKEHHLKNNDIAYHYAKNINDIVESLDAQSQFDKQAIWNIFTYCMYYTNISESHAFMENINFEMMSTLSDPSRYRLNLQYKHIEKTPHNLFIYSSGTLQIYYWLHELLQQCRNVSNIMKNDVINDNKDDIKHIYGQSMSYNKIVNKFDKTICHVIGNARKLYNYYTQLYDVNKVSLLEKGYFPYRYPINRWKFIDFS